MFQTNSYRHALILEIMLTVVKKRFYMSSWNCMQDLFSSQHVEVLKHKHCIRPIVIVMVAGMKTWSSPKKASFPTDSTAMGGGGAVKASPASLAWLSLL